MRLIQKLKRENFKAKESNWGTLRARITYSQFDALLKSQNYCCAICGRHNDEFKWGLSVDHDHPSLEIRGLLCQNCNSMIGHAKDNVHRLKQAAKYLLRQICLESVKEDTMNLMMTEDVYQCGDEAGNGCGRLFDAVIVHPTRGLCPECFADLPDEVGC